MRTRDWRVLSPGASVTRPTAQVLSALLNGSAVTAVSVLRETEAGFQRWITEAAELLGWVWYHTHDSRRSPEGFPDLVLTRERVLYREVKKERGVVDPDQQWWLDRLTAAGQDTGVWRPSDRPSILEELQRWEP